ncbi:MAG: YihY family inner membrane protein [Planctomycetes bacterium]|nr:YihY family inner membrane protein [Planctomycetota bacterium]
MLKEVLTAPTEELGKWSRFALFQLRLWRQCVRILRQNRSGTQAAALSYHTLFGLVPLAIVMLMVFQLFPAYQDVGPKVREFLYEQAHLSDIEYTIESDSGEGPQTVELTEQIDRITEGFMARLDTGKITLFSAVIVVVAALGLLTTIERSFNNIWHVGRGRNFLQRIINYWALLTLGPLLLGLGFYASTHYLTAGEFQNGAAGYLRPVLPYLISVTALFFLYFVMPNTKVSVRSAIWGAAVAALIWTLAKFVFRIYITKFIPYQAVYGVMGLVPLGVLWIFITWLIVLFGLQLTYTTQHLKTLDAAEIAAMNKAQECFVVSDFTIIRILAYILGEFGKKSGPVSVDAVCTQFNLPNSFAEKLLEHFAGAGLLFRTDEPVSGFVPATDGAQITLAEIADTACAVSFSGGDESIPAGLRDMIAAQHERLSRRTLKDVLTAGAEGDELNG